MPYCPDCGSEIDPDNVYCSNCGRQLDGGTEQPPGSDDWSGSDDLDSGDTADEGDDWAEASSGDDWDDTGDQSSESSGWDDTGGQPGNPGNRGGGGRSGRGGGGQPGQGGGGQPRQGRGGGGQPGQGGGGQGRGGQGGGWDGGGQGRGGQGGGWEGGGGQGRGGQGGGWDGGQGQSQRREWGGSNVQSGNDVYIEDGRVNFAAKFPFSDGWGALGISAVCYLASFLIIPLFIVTGYLYRITEAAAWGDTLQPRFDQYGEMIKTGFFYFLLYLVYGVVGFALFVAPIAIGASAGAEAVFVLIGFALGLVWLYFGPAVMTLYPVTGSFSQALSPSRITDFAFSGKYFGAFLLYIALYFAIQLATLVITVVLAITVIGIFLLFPLSLVVGPYLMYLTGSYWGATYYEAAQEGLVDPPWEDEQPQQGGYQGGESAGASNWD